MHSQTRQLRPQVNVVVRPYQPGDQHGVEWLYTRTTPWGRTYPRPQPVPENVRRIAESYDAVFVAVEEDQDGEAVVGLIDVERLEANTGAPLADFIVLSGPTARIHLVLVAPERWRLGIGRRLTQAAVDWARTNAFEAMLLDTTVQQEAAIALYESMGFRRKARSEFETYEIEWLELRL